MGTSLYADAVFLKTGWVTSVRLTLADGKIASVATGVTPEAGDERHAIIVPGLCNLHSHAFQRAMAGLAERRGPGPDSFWSWRSVMYGFALAFSPEDVEAVAAQLYVEMLEAGFTRVGEFHYLHNDISGARYASPAELAARISAASVTAGLSLTLLPVFYAHSGFGGAPPAEGQRRFVNSLDSYEKLLTGCDALLAPVPGSKRGVAPHSLRAVSPEELTHVVALAAGGPIHIHVAEQTKEVEDCLTWSGARPVQWLLDHAPLDNNWTLIHATHMTEGETQRMALSGAVAGLCPITEANLGDGIFPADRFVSAGGRIGIGSDSNISVSLAHELRQLEYSQRLGLRSRNVIADPAQSTGERLFAEALQGGAQALQGTGHIAVGQDADLVALDMSAVPYLTPHEVFDQWIFGDGVTVDSVWARGVKRVVKGRHGERERVSAEFLKAMTGLRARIA